MDSWIQFSNFVPTHFEWKQAPMHSVFWPLFGICIYLVTIFSLQRIMRDREAFKLHKIAYVHNIFLLALSIAMCAGSLLELTLLVKNQGFFCIICDRENIAMKGRLGIWMYVFYLSKYYELLDTVIMVLKKRPLNFLHVYHHCIVMPLFFVYMETDMVIHWILVVANSFVHCWMYYYYAMTCLGKTVSFKKYITMMQIVQFIIDLTATWPYPAFYFSQGGCSGSLRAWVFGQLVGFSFFKLFSDFYRKSYKPKSEPSEKLSEKAKKVA
mmetsp:Transcript_3698/g.6635  ORF Transcript_3698/g.6635 Transcript_3698/m.6635 type:complete len:268 (+) Transcript_3698:197-1000(+)